MTWALLCLQRKVTSGLLPSFILSIWMVFVSTLSGYAMCVITSGHCPFTLFTVEQKEWKQRCGGWCHHVESIFVSISAEIPCPWVIWSINSRREAVLRAQDIHCALTGCWIQPAVFSLLQDLQSRRQFCILCGRFYSNATLNLNSMYFVFCLVLFSICRIFAVSCSVLELPAPLTSMEVWIEDKSLVLKAVHLNSTEKSLSCTQTHLQNISTLAQMSGTFFFKEIC